jgi:hypothetical protein
MAGGLRRVGWALLRLAASYGPLLIASVAAEEGKGTSIETLTGQIASAVSMAGGLLFAMAAALFAAGLAFKFTPWASQRTKDLGGALLDHGLILAALASVGLFLLYFAGQIAVGIAGQGSVPEPGGAWGVPTQTR